LRYYRGIIILLCFFFSVISFSYGQENGSVVETEDKENTVIIENEETQEAITLEGHTGEVSCVTFSPPWYEFTAENLEALKNALAASGFEFIKTLKDKKFTLMELKNTLKEANLTEEEIAIIEENTFNPGKRILTSGSYDGTVKLWDMETKKEMATLINLDENNWLVVTPEGFFDGTPGGIAIMRWRINGELITAEELPEDFYYQGLLAEIYKEGKPLPEILKERGDPRAGLNIKNL